MLLDRLAIECQEMIELYSGLKTKDHTSQVIAAVLTELAESIENLREQTDGLRDLVDDNAKWM